MVQDYRGHKIIQHGGGTQGFRAIVVLIPEKNVGFAIVNNSEDNEFVPGLQYELLDHYLGPAEARLAEGVQGLLRGAQQGRARGAEAQTTTARPQSKPSLPLAELCRRLRRSLVRPDRDPRSGRRAHDRFPADARHDRPARALGLRHLHRRWPDPLIEPAFVTFSLNAEGKPERIR